LRQRHFGLRSAAIIPLGPGLLRDSSSLPEGQSRYSREQQHTGRAGPPLLFDLAPRGVFRAPDVATRAVGSYPTFSPLPNALDRKRRAFGFAEGLPPRCEHHRRSILCGTFRGRVVKCAFGHLAAQPPGVTRRVALPSPTPASPPRLESGLSSRPLRLRETGRRSPDSPAVVIVPLSVALVAVSLLVPLQSP